MTCPRCGTPDVTGKFCSNCGAALGGTACGQCGAAVTPGARFCHVCATPVGPGTPSGGGGGAPAWLPWGIAGAVALVLIVGGLVMLGRDESPSAPTGAAAPGSGITDISQMSPRERANRLFERVMGASDRGDTAEVRFFAPMALQAFEMIGPLDHDARYDIGLIQIAAGDAAAARVQADSILAAVPSHLFGWHLRAEAAQAEGDAAALARANRAFLEHYASEMALDRPEYAIHTNVARYGDSLRGR
jgi:hypothetical protein